MIGGGRVPRPAAVTKPALAVVAVTGALFLIAKTTGAGWLIVLLAGIGAIGFLAVVLPAPAVWKVKIDVATPADATVGVPLRVRLDVRGTSQPLLVRVGLGGDWTSVSPPAIGSLSVVPERRGVYDAVAVDTRCGAPLGLVWWRARRVCALERPVEIGPSPADVLVPAPHGGGPQGQETRAAPHAGGDLVRGVRDYRPGDPSKTVHWSATAREGRLMVKEMEAAAAPPITVAVDLRAGGEVAEAAASTAAGLALGALAAGIPVVLLTCESTGPRAGEVSTALEVNRRLARAVPGVPAEPPRGSSRVIVVSGPEVRW